LVVVLFAFVGLPPTAGFTAKFNLFLALLASDATQLPQALKWGVLAAALLATVAGLYYYLRPLAHLFFSRNKAPNLLPQSLGEVPAVGLQLLVLLVASSLLVLGVWGFDTLLNQLLAWMG
jgi:NADH-quinone oxidoreductase subunit N